jgi:hypothetical protein
MNNFPNSHLQQP